MAKGTKKPPARWFFCSLWFKDCKGQVVFLLVERLGFSCGLGFGLGVLAPAGGFFGEDLPEAGFLVGVDSWAEDGVFFVGVAFVVEVPPARGVFLAADWVVDPLAGEVDFFVVVDFAGEDLDPVDF